MPRLYFSEKRCLVFLFSLFCFSFLAHPASACTQNACAVLNPVSGNNNQTQITAALKKGGAVHLNPGIYTISDSIILASNVTLEGDRGAHIKLVAQANWPKLKPMLNGTGVSNVRITGFEIDGNRGNNLNSNGAATACGHDFYDMVLLKNSANIEIDHMYLHDNWNDIVISKETNGLNFHDNLVHQPGHDIVSIYRSGTTYVTNNCMRLYCNSATRADTGGPLYVINNDIARDTGAGGFAGIEVEDEGHVPMSVYSCNNNIHNVKTAVAYVEGGSVSMLHTEGCPIAPPVAPIAKSCSFADLGK